jgi:hypothetical protein
MTLYLEMGTLKRNFRRNKGTWIHPNSVWLGVLIMWRQTSTQGEHHALMEAEIGVMCLHQGKDAKDGSTTGSQEGRLRQTGERSECRIMEDSPVRTWVEDRSTYQVERPQVLRPPASSTIRQPQPVVLCLDSLGHLIPLMKSSNHYKWETQF